MTNSIVEQRIGNFLWCPWKCINLHHLGKSSFQTTEVSLKLLTDMANKAAIATFRNPISSHNSLVFVAICNKEEGGESFSSKSWLTFLALTSLYSAPFEPDQAVNLHHWPTDRMPLAGSSKVRACNAKKCNWNTKNRLCHCRYFWCVLVKKIEDQMDHFGVSPAAIGTWFLSHRNPASQISQKAFWCEPARLLQCTLKTHMGTILRGV